MYIFDLIDLRKRYPNCIINCIESLYYKKYKCLPNAYIDKEFILMNASQTQYTICGHNNTNTEYSVNKNYCKEKCVKNCHQKYYSLELEDIEYTARNDSKIRIEYT